MKRRGHCLCQGDTATVTLGPRGCFRERKISTWIFGGLNCLSSTSDQIYRGENGIALSCLK